jgi:hypothetical protein
VTRVTSPNWSASDHHAMARVLYFPARSGVLSASEPSLREILRERGIEPTEDERRRKRREAAARRQMQPVQPTTENGVPWAPRSKT